MEPTAGLITAHEGQLYINAFATAELMNPDAHYIELTVQQLFLTEGDLFAFKVEPTGAEGNLLGAVVEYCDNDMSLRAVSKFNNTVIGVSTPKIPSRQFTGLILMKYLGNSNLHNSISP